LKIVSLLKVIAAVLSPLHHYSPYFQGVWKDAWKGLFSSAAPYSFHFPVTGVSATAMK